MKSFTLLAEMVVSFILYSTQRGGMYRCMYIPQYVRMCVRKLILVATTSKYVCIICIRVPTYLEDISV